MGCSCVRENEEEKSVSKRKEREGGGRTERQKNPSKSDLESLQADVRVRAVDSVHTLTGQIRDSYRFIRTVEDEERHRMYLVADIITMQRCMIKEVPKRRKKNCLKLPLEAEIWSKLDHPHVTKLYEVVQNDSHLFFIFEAHQGGELITYVEDQAKLYEDTIAAIMHQIFSILEYSHKQRVIYRNLDLRNFVLHCKPTLERIYVKLMRLEDACLASNKKPLLPYFADSLTIAPEVHCHRYTEKCDIWSCGILMYRLALRESPYGTANEIELLDRARRGALRLSASMQQELSKEACKLLQSLLALNPEDRPSAAECLASPWMQHFVSQASAGPDVLQQAMQNIAMKRNMCAIRRAVMKFIVNRIVPPEELAELAKLFKELDEDDDGQISREELLKGLMKVMDRAAAEREVDRAMKECDENSNGAIDYTEFLILTCDEKNLLCESNLRMAFQSLDREQGRCIDMKKLKELLFIREGGEEELWQLIMREADTSGDGEIDFGEFHRLMRKASFV